MRGEPSARRRRRRGGAPRASQFFRVASNEQLTAPFGWIPAQPSPVREGHARSLGSQNWAGPTKLCGLNKSTSPPQLSTSVTLLVESSSSSRREKFQRDFLFIYFWILGSAADAVEYRSRGARRSKLFSGCAGVAEGGAARRGGMDTMRGALERARMLVGMEVDEESAPEEQSFFDDVTRNCALTTTQASSIPTPPTQPGSIRVPRSDLVDASSDCSSKCGWLIVLKSWCLFFGISVQRLYGFAICLAAGLTCTFLVSFTVWCCTYLFVSTSGWFFFWYKVM